MCRTTAFKEFQRELTNRCTTGASRPPARPPDQHRQLAAASWPVEVLTEMMHGHLEQTLRQATAQLTGDYAASVAEYDHIVTHILDMADALATGIVTQFPERF